MASDSTSAPNHDVGLWVEKICWRRNSMTIPPDAHLHKPDINGTTVLLLKLSELSLCLIFRLSIERKPGEREASKAKDL